MCTPVGSWFSAPFLIQYLQVTIEGKHSISQIIFGKNSLIKANKS